MREPDILLELPRGPKECLRVSISEFKGREYCDVRIWYIDRDGVTRPGKSGITLRPDAIPAVIEALQAAFASLEVSR
jgi:hypothetical protein